LSGYVLEENLPKTLPNPKKLIFTGAVTAEYDGSEEQTINIPESSGGGMTEEQISLLNGKIDSPQTAEVGQTIVVEEIDENGKPIKWKCEDVAIGGTAISNVEPTEDDIPKVFFDEAIPQTKTDTITKFRYISTLRILFYHFFFYLSSIF
jgi:hypothetical protein